MIKNQNQCGKIFADKIIPKLIIVNENNELKVLLDFHPKYRSPPISVHLAEQDLSTLKSSIQQIKKTWFAAL